MILFAAAMTISFVACDGSKKETATEESAQTEETTEVVATETVESTAGSAEETLAKYEKFVNDIIPIMEKVQKGDAAAIQEYTKIASDAQTLSADIQKYMSDMTPDQMKRWEEISKKYADAVQAMTPQQ